jgi:hypothetical protein
VQGLAATSSVYSKMSEELKAQFPEEWAVFSALVDGTGELDKDDLWCKLASTVDDEQATQLIEIVDKNGDGKIDFCQFCDAFENLTIFQKILSAKQCAFVFCKPHANTEAVQQLVRDQFAQVGVAITSEGEIRGELIDEKQYIDQHYYAIASKATLMKPAELNVPAERFAAEFGEEVRTRPNVRCCIVWRRR